MDKTEISAGRLHLRPWQPGDAAALRRLNDDPEVARWTPHPSPYTLADARRRLAEDDDRWADGSRAELAVLDAASADLLGAVGLYRCDGGTAEIGWLTAAGERGRGVAGSAVPAVCRWAFGAIGLSRLEAHVGVGNAASRAVAEKSGFRLEGVRRTARDQTWVLSMLAGDEPVDRRPLPPPPRLSDGVVVLRAPAETDAPELARGCDDPVTARWLPVPSPYTADDGLEYVRAAARQWADGAGASFAVVGAGDGALLGTAALTLTQRTRGVGEVGYWTTPTARGRGAAGRAAALLGRWGLQELGLGRIELLADVGNTASQRVAEKVGFIREGVARQARAAARDEGRRDFVLYSLVADDLTLR